MPDHANGLYGQARRRALRAGIATVALIVTAPVWAQSPAGESEPPVSTAAIQEVLGENRVAVRECISGDELPSRIDLVVDFVIGVDGRVESTNMVESNANSTALDGCVLDVIATLIFPQPRDGSAYAVRYPLLFVTGG